MTRSGRLRTAIFIAAVVVIAILYVAVARHWLSVDSLRSHRDALLQFTSAHHRESLAILMAACIVLVALSAPVSGVIMLLGGMLFGRWVGTLVVAISVSLGAVFAMLIVRYLLSDFVRARLRGHRRAQELLKGFERHQGSYLLFLRIAPGFPFWLTNVLFGLTAMPAWRFLLLTLVGIVPDAFIYGNIGAHLATVRSRHDLLSPGGILALGLLAILCVSPLLLRAFQRRRPGWPFGSS
jgi:uncharacterized membrane protein YdjX (TVP38/TMEM64 family)